MFIIKHSTSTVSNYWHFIDSRSPGLLLSNLQVFPPIAAAFAIIYWYAIVQRERDGEIREHLILQLDNNSWIFFFLLPIVIGIASESAMTDLDNIDRRGRSGYNEWILRGTAEERDGGMVKALISNLKTIRTLFDYYFFFLQLPILMWKD